MAKLIFEDRSYLEITKSPTTDKITITIVARDGKNTSSTIANSVEVSLEQFNELIKL